MPPHIADVLVLLHVLLGYARHLTLTLENRAAARGFSVIAQFFGTARLPLIRARLARGLLRIQALQRVLLDRGRRGRDLAKLQPRRRRPRPAPAQPPAPDFQDQPQADRPQADRPLPRRRPDPDPEPDPDNLPTLKQLEAQIRRHPIGQAVADICSDLGVSFSLCDRVFGFALFEAITWYRGNLVRLTKGFRRREVAIEPELDGTPPLRLPEQTADGIRYMVGFLIGERWPVRPHWVPAPRRAWAEAATGPP